MEYVSPSCRHDNIIAETLLNMLNLVPGHVTMWYQDCWPNSKFESSETSEKWAAMAEWLRRLTRNQMGSSRVGSNPTRSGSFFFCENSLELKTFFGQNLDKNDHDGIRTHNLLIRSQTPYPLGHATCALRAKNRRYRQACCLPVNDVIASCNCLVPWQLRWPSG